jgi:hypothetical protein
LACNTYGPGTCEGTCVIAGHSLNPATHECMMCAANCTSCSTANKCDSGKCMRGFAYDSTYQICLPCATNCTSGCANEGAGCCDVVTGTSSGTCSAGTYIANPSVANCHYCI